MKKMLLVIVSLLLISCEKVPTKSPCKGGSCPVPSPTPLQETFLLPTPKKQVKKHIDKMIIDDKRAVFIKGVIEDYNVQDAVLHS